MSGKMIVLLVLVAVVAASAFPQDQVETDCGPNEYFDKCGTQCEPTCKHPEPVPCTLRCMIGCQCKDGYVRDNEGKCVLLRSC